QGHDVTLYAAGGSTTAATLVTGWHESLRLGKDITDPIAIHYVLLEKLMRKAHEYDVIHFHLDYLHYPLSARASYNHVTTLHGRLDIPELFHLYQTYRDLPLISISKSQRRPLPFC